MATKKQEKQEVVTPVTQTTAVIPSYGQFAGQGQEDLGQVASRTPFLKVLQALTPECQEGEDSYVAGAKPGLLMNTATKECLKSVRGVVVAVVRKFAEYTKAPEGQRGKFEANHEPESDVVREATARAKSTKEKWKLFTKDGNPLVETYAVFMLMTDDSGAPVGPVILPITRTKIKKLSEFRSRISSFPGSKNVPIFCHQVTVSTVRDKSPKGPFFNVEFLPTNGDTVSSLLPADSPLIPLAAALREQAMSMDLAPPVEDDDKQESMPPEADKVF